MLRLARLNSGLHMINQSANELTICLRKIQHLKINHSNADTYHLQCAVYNKND